MSNLKLVLLASVAMLPLAPALAQTADPPAAASGGAIALPTVEVTATEGGSATGGEGVNAPNEGYNAPAVSQTTTKIDVPTFDLPIAVQTVPEQIIQDQSAFTIQEAIENVSGVRSANNNVEGYVFNIRGFDSFNVFRDGLLIGVAIPQSYDTSNLQDVQVLKGPASFLFGRADPGGVINLVTKKPLDAPYYSISQDFGSFNLYRTVWDLTGPVQVPELDKGALSYRFSGSYTNGGQFVDFINNSNVFLAPSVTWKIDPATTLTVDGQYTHQDAQSFVGIPAVGSYPASLPVYRSLQEPNEPPDTVRSALIAYDFKHHFDNNWTITNRFLAARATITKSDLTGGCFFFLDPTAPGPCQDQAGNDLQPQDLVRNITYQKLTGTNYSANLDLTGKFYVGDVKNNVLIGTDYFYQYFNYILSGAGNFPINIYNPVYGTVPTSAYYGAPLLAWGGGADFTSFSSHAEKDLGIYAQDLITLFDSLHILLGARYDLADERSGNSNTFSTLDAIPNIGEAYARFGSNPVQHNQAFSPRVGVNYQPVPWLGFYGSYTKSFGAANGISSNDQPLPPEIGEGWEGGVKAELLDRRLAATLAFFDITKSNVLTPIDPLDPFSEVRPIGQARSTGAELDVLGRITNELSVIASYAHIDARVIKDNGGLMGLALPRFAPNSGSVFLTYDFPTDSEMHGWRVGGGVFAAGNRWGDDQNTLILPAYARLDAFAKYAFTEAGVRWSAQINVNNITDAKYFPSTDFFFNNSPRLGSFPGTPRSIIATLRAEY